LPNVIFRNWGEKKIEKKKTNKRKEREKKRRARARALHILSQIAPLPVNLEGKRGERGAPEKKRKRGDTGSAPTFLLTVLLGKKGRVEAGKKKKGGEKKIALADGGKLVNLRVLGVWAESAKEAL